jgi:hypothetical protein
MTARNKSAEPAGAAKLSARHAVFRMRNIGDGRVIYAGGQKVRQTFRQVAKRAQKNARQTLFFGALRFRS